LTYSKVNVTDIVRLPGGLFSGLTSDAQHELGIHDFYRYGLWGFCEGFNTTVVSCTNPKPGNSTNPIASIDEEITKDVQLPLPADVEKDVHRLQSASLFIFACWIIGPVFGFLTMLLGVSLGCRSVISTFVTGIFALVR